MSGVTATNPAPTEPATATVPPPASDTPFPMTNTTCNEMSLFLDPALASRFNCQSVAEAADTSLPPFAINPKYTEITLQGYSLATRMMTPHIDVFPVERYEQLLPDTLPTFVTDLQSLINGTEPGTKDLALLPIQNAGQLLHVQYQVFPFASGKGTRFLTEYAQFFDPINNFDMFYTFQGLTSDEKYWISAILPISNPILPADGKNPPDDQSWDVFGNAFPKYIYDITTQLNSQAPENFSPSIPMLDTLIASIRIQP
ncbi:MAG: hypothetical protein ABSA01_05465 [Anaerolineales bacterium]|jgi:hypothetical protein